MFGGKSMGKKSSNSRAVRFNRWGYYFLIPFFTVYIIFSFIPLVSTIYNSFFEEIAKLINLKVLLPTFIIFVNH